jgi:hypothetical protein
MKILLSDVHFKLKFTFLCAVTDELQNEYKENKTLVRTVMLLYIWPNALMEHCSQSTHATS